jgi:putative phosphoesterase
MPVGVLTDVHGNSVALDAVIDDARSVDVDRWWVLGDLVAMGPDPVGTLDRLRSLDPEVRILGNTERYVLREELPFPPTDELELTPKLVDQMVETAASIAWTRGSLDDDAIAWLDGSTRDHKITLADGTRLLAVHASAHRDDGAGVSPDRSDDELLALFPGLDADLVLAGHTHDVTDRVIGRVRFVNPGSISNHPSDERRANYLVLHDREGGHELEFRSVDYDIDSVIAQLRVSALPGRQFVLERYFGR